MTIWSQFWTDQGERKFWQRRDGVAVVPNIGPLQSQMMVYHPSLTDAISCSISILLKRLNLLAELHPTRHTMPTIWAVHKNEKKGSVQQFREVLGDESHGPVRRFPPTRRRSDNPDDDDLDEDDTVCKVCQQPGSLLECVRPSHSSSMNLVPSKIPLRRACVADGK